MKKRKLKPVVKIVIISIALAIISIGVLLSSKTNHVMKENNDFIYVNDYIFDNYLPVINNEEMLAKPFSDEEVTIYKSFYDKDKSKEEQQKALIYYENIYMQNSGIDYKSDKEFNILSSVTGMVTNISEDKLLGKTIEIKDANGIVTTYQCLSEISVKKQDNVNKGQVIGKSGSCNLYKDVKNGLHFELYINGTAQNPEAYYDKPLATIINNQNED